MPGLPMTDKIVSEALPRTPDGRTYITDQMLVENPHLWDFLTRTSSQWERSFNGDYYIMKERNDPTRSRFSH